MPRKIEGAEPAGARPMSDGRAAKVGTGFERLLTPKEATQFLRVSKLVLACQNAHARGRTAVPKKFGRSIRYTEAGILQWMRSRQRFSTNQRSVVAASIQVERQLLAGFIVESTGMK
jgi:hypothetical protein